MSGPARWMLGIVLGAVAVHVGAVWAAPRLIMSTAIERLTADTPPNVFLHPPLATADSRSIVRPSPDLAYSSAVFDVSQRALRVRVPVTAPYTSVSGFAAQTDNVFAVNDLEAKNGWIELVLVGPGTPPVPDDGARRVASPTDRGILLVRRVVTSPEALPEIEAARARESLEPVPAH